MHSMPKMWKFLMTGGAVPVGVAAVEAFRVAEGIPVYGVDMVERDLPQETSQTRALHFNKGCYLGQEIVERIRSRGNVHKHLRALELEPAQRGEGVPGGVAGNAGEGALPAKGTELKLDGAAVGNMTSVAELPLPGGTRRFALGMVKGEAEAKNQPMTFEAGEAAGTARLRPCLDTARGEPRDWPEERRRAWANEARRASPWLTGTNGTIRRAGDASPRSSCRCPSAA